jgi:hypothetical protein
MKVPRPVRQLEKTSAHSITGRWKLGCGASRSAVRKPFQAEGRYTLKTRVGRPRLFDVGELGLSALSPAGARTLVETLADYRQFTKWFLTPFSLTPFSLGPVHRQQLSLWQHEDYIHVRNPSCDVTRMPTISVIMSVASRIAFPASEDLIGTRL